MIRSPLPSRLRGAVARTRAAIAAMLVGLLALSGCAVAQGATLTDNTLVIAIESEADILDPQSAGGWVTWRINRQIFEPLVTEDLRTPSSEASVPALEGGLAESWDISEDGKTYTFHIRQGVTFHDGEPLDADAVEYNVRRMWDPESPQYSSRAAGQTSKVWQFTEDVRTPDKYTVVVELSQPFSAFIRMLAQGGGGSTAIMSPKSIEEWGPDVADHPVGTGPFKFDERIRGERISLTRNDDYWGTTPQLDGVVFRPMPNSSARIAALRAGEVDIVTVPSPDSVDAIREEGFTISEGTPPHLWYLSFNHTDPNMQKWEVRKAINLAIDREGMASDLLSDTVLPAYDVQPPAIDVWEKRDDLFYRDLAEARELLASVGLEDGFSTTLITSTDGSGQIIPAEMAQYIQQNLAEIGIDVTLHTQEWISYISFHNEGLKDGTGMGQMSWGMTTPFWLYLVASKTQIAPNGSNVGYYDNPELEAAMNEAITSPTEEEALPHWAEANEIAAEDYFMVPVVNDKAPMALSPRVTGFVSASEEWYDLIEVGLQ
ncbi:ABC transporter substrate-binding protein [Brevibacterium litoralis]|uniref:ABC transporter substrate-binding protein n=1 Tax=Brevibacterium litoralis TaxID=3138935 RepID=UPI0032EC142D